MQWSKFRRFLPPVLFVVLASGVVLLFWASDTSPFDEYFEKATLLDAIIYAAVYSALHLFLIIPVFVVYWNRALVKLFNLPRIDYWKAVALFVLSLFHV